MTTLTVIVCILLFGGAVAYGLWWERADRRYRQEDQP